MKHLITTMALLALSACAAPTQLVDTATRLNVVDVTIDMSTAEKGTGARFQLDKASAAQILDQIVTQRLEQADDDTGQPVTVNLKVDMLYLAGGAYAVLLGSTNSAAHVTLSASDQVSGVAVLSDTKITASGSRRPGMLGAADIKSQPVEMQLVSSSLAEKIKVTVFGD